MQRRVQRYGWDLAADDYEALWQDQLAPVQSALLRRAAPAIGESILDVACGTGLVTVAAARAAGPAGRVVGVDISGQMVDSAGRRARDRGLAQVEFARMDAESLTFADGSFDLALCSLGLMYMPEPERALREMRRVLRPGGRLAIAVWGDRSRCGWASLFEIVQAEVASEVCPLFFRLGTPVAVERACREAGFDAVEPQVLSTTLSYVDADQACRAAFIGGPVALGWSRFDSSTRARVSAAYTDSISMFRAGRGYEVPAEFVVLHATASSPPGSCAR